MKKRWIKRLIVFMVLGLLVGCGKDVTKETQNPTEKKEKEDTEEKEKEDTEKKIEKLRTEKKEVYDADASAIWQDFSDNVILGDSRAYGFMSYQFLGSDVVMADVGGTIKKVPSYVSQLQQKNPKKVFICYGINDIGIYDTPEKYTAAYSQMMDDLQKALPNTDIYVCSVLWAYEPSYERCARWANIPDYNVALRAMCQDKGYHYIDNDNLCEEYQSLWASDGVHVAKSFYAPWAENMLLQSIEASDLQEE